MKLTENEIEKIKLEINLRDQTRNNTNDVSRKGKIWFYLNSPFGLWFLSTIVISAITFSYTSINLWFEEKKSIENQITKLDTEIESRIYQFQIITSRQRDSTNIQNDSSLLNAEPQLKNNWLEFKKIPKESSLSFYSVFSEFDKKPIISLISELTSLVTDKKEKNEISNVNQIIISNRLIPINIYREDEQGILNTIVDSIRIERWRKTMPIN